MKDDGNDFNEDDESSEGSVTDIFESALESLFGYHVTAHGEPGQLTTYRPPLLPSPYRTSSAAEGSDEVDKDRPGKCNGNGDRVIRYRIPPNETNALFAHYQWDAGVLLADSIVVSSRGTDDISASRSAAAAGLHVKAANVQSQHILELGAGTGLPSIVATVLCGASKVVVTDYPAPGLLDTLRSNVQTNIESSDHNSDSKVVAVQGLDWAAAPDREAIVHAHGTFERVFSADGLWMGQLHEALILTITTCLSRTATARAIIVAGFHTGRPTIARFIDMAASFGLMPDAEGDTEYGGAFERCVDGQTRKWSGADDEDSRDNDHVERTRWVFYATLRWKDTFLESQLQST